MPRPQWDTTYTFDLECLHADLENLDCGRFEVKAIIEEASKECLRSEPTCPVNERVHFMSPETITGRFNTDTGSFILLCRMISVECPTNFDPGFMLIGCLGLPLF